MRLPNIAIQRFEVEAKLAQMLRFKASDLEFESDQRVQTAMKEQEIIAKSRPPTWMGNSDLMKQKSRSSSIKKLPEFGQEPEVQSASVGWAATPKLEHIGIPENPSRVRVRLSHQWRDFFFVPVGFVELPHADQVRPREAP